MAAKKKSESKGAFAYEGLDRVLHEKARLGILTALLTSPGGRLFTDLRELCAMTDGNLSRHIQVLQEAELVEVWKGYDGKRPQTLLRISKGGRKAFLAYLQELERVIRVAKTSPAPAKGVPAPPGWMPA